MHKNTLKKLNSQLHPNSLSPTRQEKTLFFLLMLLLGYYELSLILMACPVSQNLIYIYIYIYIYVIGRLLQGVTILFVLGFLILLVFGLEE